MASGLGRTWMTSGAWLALLSVSSSVSVANDFTDFRGLWVTRYDYRNGSAATVQNIVDNAASLGITDLMFQVRGNADAYYDSNVEPRAAGLSTSWDPLQVAIDRAGQHGMKLHAWINTMPLWAGTTPPSTATPIPAPFYHEDPSYRVYDLNGNPQPLNNSYVIANPILPEWHQHVSNVAQDIVSNYAVDGVHLDYVRWVGDTSWASLPHDDYSHQLFTASTGLSATSQNSSAYRQFIRDQITSLVTDVGAAIDATNPAAELSAAVWRDPYVGSSSVLQEYRTWMEQDLVDTIIPMMYLSPENNHLLQPNLTNVLSIETNARVAPGIGVYLHDDPQFTVSQLSTMVHNGTGGVTLYAYSSFFSSGQLGNDRFDAVKSFLDSVDTGTDPGGRGDIVSITDFEVDEGYFASSPTYSGSNFGINSASANRITSDAFEGSGSQQIIIDGSDSGWLLRHVSGIGAIASPSGNLPLVADGYVGLWLKTSDSGLRVQLALDDPNTADRGFTQSLIADGEWHLYEWNLDDNSQWLGWVNGDGLITGPTVTLDSIQFSGNGDARILIDAVGQNTGGSLWMAHIYGDFDEDGDYDLEDVDALVEQIVEGSDAMRFDLNADGVVNGDDLQSWFAEAGGENLGPGSVYLVGDGNLDGVVDVSDFNTWNSSDFATGAGYSGGDYNADGAVDVSDFNLWNANKFRSSLPDGSMVPEPSGALARVLLLCGMLVFARKP